MVTANMLKEFPFFKNLTEEQLEKVAAISCLEEHGAGTQMYKKGDPARSLFLVRSGKVILTLENYMGPHRPPLQVTVDTITKGETMGWSAVVEPYIYTLAALCIDDSSFVATDSEKLRALMEADSDLAYKIMREIAKVISSRLTHTQIILVGERGLSHLTDY